MANLGFQAVFHIFESDDSAPPIAHFCPTRMSAILPRWRRAPWSPLSGRPLSDFDILAFSISFETDYLNVLSVFAYGRIPARRADRAGRNFPLIIAGGSAVFLNPDRSAVYRSVLIGEGEEMVPSLSTAGMRRAIAESIARARLGRGRVSARLLHARF